jgi:hypothetical protein
VRADHYRVPNTAGDKTHSVIYDKIKNEWSCTCIHGSVYRFKKNAGICRHIKEANTHRKNYELYGGDLSVEAESEVRTTL